MMYSTKTIYSIKFFFNLFSMFLLPSQYILYNDNFKIYKSSEIFYVKIV